MALPILSIMISLPLIGAGITYLMGKENVRASKFFAVGVTLATFLLSIVTITKIDFTNPSYQLVEEHIWARSFGMTYLMGVDGISYPFILLTTLLSLMAVASSWHIDHRTNTHYALLLLLQAALTGVFTSLDLFLFYIFWEIVLVPMYFLIGIWGGPRREYSAIKFFIYTHFASLAVLLSIIAFYFNTTPHTFSMIEIAKVAPTYSHTLQTILFAALFFGFAVKMPTFPFHTWLPDAHVEAPTAGSIHLAGVLLKMGGYGLIRLGVMMIPDGARTLAPVMVILAVLSAFYGAFCAMAQKDIKKLIAYSSVSHMGYVLLGIAAFNVIGISGAIYEMMAHGIITGGLFFLSGIIHDHAGSRIIEKIIGFGKRTPIMTAIIAISFLASMGLPGLAGFVAEFLIFVGAFSAYKFVTIIVVFSVVFTAGYFLWTLQRLAFRPPHPNLPEHIEDMETWTELIPLLILVFLMVLLGVYPPHLLNMMDASVRNLVLIIGG
ncbi:MAG: NuoM family protein [Candidatus Hydrothermarchaeales archaeon]